jgi:hypothetical protein
MFGTQVISECSLIFPNKAFPTSPIFKSIEKVKGIEIISN